MKRLLFIVHRMPYPPDKGERLRAFQELKALSQHFRITLATLAHSTEDYRSAAGIRHLCERIVVAPAGGRKGLIRGGLGMLAGRSVTEGYFHSPSLEKLVTNLSHGREFPVALGYSSSTLPYLLKANASHRIMDLVDVDSEKWLAYAEKASWLTKWLYRREGEKVRHLEEDALINCDAVLVVSQAESELLAGFSHKIGVLSNGVDTDYFQADEGGQDGKPSLVFTGTMDYRPNIDGVCWFAEKVWPDLKRRQPELQFYIVGRDPAPAVGRLAEQRDIIVTGTVADVRPYLASAQVAICPLRIARGIQNKVLEAMAMGRAVVSSGPALEGLEVEVGKEALRADTPEEWQSHILSLLENDDQRLEIGRNARACVEAKYNWQGRMSNLVALCDYFYQQYEEKIQVGERSRSGKTGQAGARVPAAAGEAAEKSATAGGVVQRRKRRWLPSNTKEICLWLVTTLYIAFLTVVTLWPDNAVKGEGWLDTISPAMQNFLHIPAYSGLMVLVTLAMCPTMGNRLVGITLAALCCFGFGICMEYAQSFVPGRRVSVGDMLRNGSGILIVLPILFFWLWRPAARHEK